MRTLSSLYLASAIALIAFALLPSCNTQKKTPPLVTGHNSRLALDWPGLYVGVLPCADCEGILTEIKINPDNTYELATQYLGKSREVVRKRGAFKWDAAGMTIRLVGAGNPSGDVRCQVVENALLQLDKDGKRIEGEQADMYCIAKYHADDDIREKYWRLIELDGKPIVVGGAERREPHIVLKFNGRLIGSSGCNRITGGYTLQEGNRVQFSRVASPLMACPGIEYEDRFLNALNAVDNYAICNDTLTLAKGKAAPTARFVAVYLH